MMDNSRYKFRAWDKDRKQMFTSPKWVEFSVNIEGELSAKNYDRAGNEQYLDIIQFTGLKDKNGKEIFESDIIRIDRVLDKNITTIVKYETGSFTAHIPDTNENGTIYIYRTLAHWAQEAVEIIGNIYQNSDLIK
jgi:uncharacterized phage protein (TIGR01671 family)